VDHDLLKKKPLYCSYSIRIGDSTVGVEGTREGTESPVSIGY